MHQMPTTMVSDNVLAVVKQYCGQKVIAQFIADQLALKSTENDLLKDDVADQGEDIAHMILGDAIAFDHLLTICKHHLNDYEYMEFLLAMGTAFKSHGHLHRAEQMFNKVVLYSQRLKHLDFAAEALLRRGEIFSRQGRWQESNLDLKQSRKLFLKANDMTSVAKVENVLGTSYAEQGRLKQANLYFSKALRNSERSEQKKLAATIFMNLGIIQNIIGNWDEALNHYHRALTLFESAADVTRMAEVHHNMGMSYLAKQNMANAGREFDLSLEYSIRLYNTGLIGLAKLGKARVYVESKDMSLALAFTNQALEHFTMTNDQLSIADAYKVKGMVFREMGKYDLAATHFQSSVRINEEYENLLNLGETNFEIGVLEQLRQRNERARDAFRTALQYFQQVGASVEISRTQQHIHSSEKTA